MGGVVEAVILELLAVLTLLVESFTVVVVLEELLEWVVVEVVNWALAEVTSNAVTASRAVLKCI
jgi:hypothetical protein